MPPAGMVVGKMKKIYILMATYNGASFVSAQIDSIRKQSIADWELWISDDESQDGTLDIVKSYSNMDPRIHVLETTNKYGSAGKNFFNALKTIDLNGCDYVAFSDQDDLWNPDKLEISLNKITLNGACGYSSDVIAFWPNGKKKYIKKSGEQKQWDYLFEPAGPGCTYVLKREFARQLQLDLQEGKIDPSRIYAHDWLIYAKARSLGFKWVIDSNPSLLYRQHGNNEVGVNSGFRAIAKRLGRLRCGWYLDQVYEIAAACENLKQLNLLIGSRDGMRLRFFNKFMQTRRSSFEALILLVFMVFGVAR